MFVDLVVVPKIDIRGIANILWGSAIRRMSTWSRRINRHTSDCRSPNNICNPRNVDLVTTTKSTYVGLQIPKEYLQSHLCRFWSRRLNRQTWNCKSPKNIYNSLFIVFCIMRSLVLNATVLTALKYMPSNA
jgi:Txe/YoeB family toxin of Txe-Axe toxin-antitoxin module